MAIGPYRLHYVDDGRGSPLLMVHGNPTWSFYWRNLITAFRGTYRVIAVDHIGCGLSDKPAHYHYTLDQHIDNLVQLVDNLDLHHVTLVAHDWGGAIGLGAALARPDRFAAFILFNTGAFPPPFIPWRIRACRIPGLGTIAVQGLNLFARAALTMAIADGNQLSSEVKAGLLAPYDCWAHRVAINQFIRDIPSQPSHPTWQTLARIEQQLRRFRDHPCQLIWGMQDWCFRPSCLERLNEIFPAAEVHRLTDASHYVVEDAHPQIIPRMERFLAANGIRT